MRRACHGDSIVIQTHDDQLAMSTTAGGNFGRCQRGFLKDGLFERQCSFGGRSGRHAPRQEAGKLSRASEAALAARFANGEFFVYF
jgi:hypothetical protein